MVLVAFEIPFLSDIILQIEGILQISFRYGKIVVFSIMVSRVKLIEYLDHDQQCFFHSF